MDSSRRAVESYWRSRMIDGATSDEDKVTPVYKLEEICELLRSSHFSIVKEVSEFIFKRLEHKSPIVKQKALRLIKYAVGKSGVEFRREMQRNSVAVRQLFHYKGQSDPLKGDALNKAVRDTAHEAISAIFSADDNKPPPVEDLNKRIEGFGNTNFGMVSEDKKSFLSEVVDIGSATIKQGLSSLTQAQSSRKNDNGSYKSPTLRRSLTTETNYPDRYDKVEHHSETQSAYGFPKNSDAGPWGKDSRITKTDTTNGESASSITRNKTCEERLLETIVTSGGVRLQPTRDALQVFLMEALKLDTLALSEALKSKLQSPLWQVRMKAMCVLEAILRKRDVECFMTVASYFSENKDVVLRCSESPQASLREKTEKVLSLLGGDRTGSRMGHSEKPVKVETAAFQMPNLIDTGDSDDFHGTKNSMEEQSDQSIANPTTSTTAVIDDLFGDSLVVGMRNSEQKNDDDPFADVSFHTSYKGDLFSGMDVDKAGAAEIHTATNKNEAEIFDIFGSNSQLPQEDANHKKDVHDLVAGLSINENTLVTKQNRASSHGALSEIFPDSTMNPTHPVSNDVLNSIFGSQAAGMNANTMFPLGPIPYNLPSGIMLNPVFPSQPMNYGAMGNLFAQGQFLTTMSNFQQLGNLPMQDAGVSPAAGTKGGALPSPLPDIFNPSIPTQTPSSMLSSSKKEDTRAFDFISDHLATARDPKRVV
ncbi:protein MODIFIED TRANSPORT TO THE VACUOLE 1-like [Cornus florida]|uniref:protein MODIFIED TRANSPORT TO THE VACUOLE 1-like n=1 Tax=Cornus florida TaxID=4283 RepID=UPI002897B1EB|nr:protein MODIFIED TRANSPORT TO THE VACUOLE 1-like [Cornus florida]